MRASSPLMVVSAIAGYPFSPRRPAWQNFNAAPKPAVALFSLAGSRNRPTTFLGEQHSQRRTRANTPINPRADSEDGGSCRAPARPEAGAPDQHQLAQSALRVEARSCLAVIGEKPQR